MHGVAQKLTADSGFHRLEIAPVEQREASVLVITADLGFYSGVLLAACAHRWRAHWARSVSRALEISRSEHTPLVVYDANLPWTEWQAAFERLIEVSPAQRILLASPSISEELWREVLKYRGYDVVPRTARSAELARALRFAWLSMAPREEPVITPDPLRAVLHP
jgi:hypothetical protein